MNIHRRLIPKIVAVLVGALIPIVSNVPMAQATCSQYQIGYQGPLTGSEAYFGQDQLAAVKFALSKFRSANPSVNVSPDVVQIDDQGDPSVAAVVAPTVAANSCILGIVGPAFTGAAIVSFPAYKAAGLPVITPSATRPSLTDPTSPAFGGPIFHRNVLLDSQIYLDMFSDIGAATPKANVAYFHQDAYNSMPTGGPLGVNLWDFAFQPDQTSINLQIKNAYDGGIRYFVFDDFDFTFLAGFASYLKTLGSSQLIVGPMSTGSILNKSDANLANAWFYSGSNNLGIINPTLGADYKNLLGVDPGLYSADSFDSAMFLLDGIKAGSTTRSALNTYISTRTFQGLAGPVSFDANGELEKRKSSKVVLSSGVLSVANGATVGINGNLSSTAKSVPVPNFQFKVTEWDLSATASKTYFHFPGYNSVVESKSSVINTFLPNGTTKFEIESMSDSQGPNMRKTYYEATVSAGVLTQLSDISNPAAPVTITKTGDTYVLKYKSFNFVATISGDTDFSGSLGIIFEKGSPDKGIAKVVVDSGNKLSAVLDPTKNYRIDFYPAGANSKFDLTTWDNISFNGASTLAYSATLTASNIFGKINPYPSGGGTVKVLTKDSIGLYTVVAKERAVGSDGTFGFQLTPGAKFKIKIEPISNAHLGPNTSSEYTAPSSGSLTLSDISFLGADVSATMTSAAGAVVGANFYVYLVEGDNWTDAYSGQTDATGNFSIFLPVGTYKIIVDPSNVSYLLQYTEIDCVVTSISSTVNCGATLIPKNISGTVTFDGTSAGGRTIDNRGFDAQGNSYIDQMQISTDSKFGLQGQLGYTYEFVVGSSPSDLNQTTMGLTTRTCATENVAKTCNINLQTNFNFQISDSSGTLLKNLSTAVVSSGYSPQDMYFYTRIFEAKYLNTYSKLALPNGIYYVTADDRHTSNQFIGLGVGNTYKVTVTGGVVSEVKEMSSGTVLLAVAGIYTLKTKVPNFKIKAFDGTAPLNNSIILIRDINQGKLTYPSIINSNINEFALPDGSYQIELMPIDALPVNKANGLYFVVIKDGVPFSVTKTGTTDAVQPVSGYYSLTLGVPNVTGTVTKGGSAISSTVLFQKWNEVNGSWDWEAGRDVGNDGLFSFNLSPGKYRGILYINYLTSKGLSIVGSTCTVPSTGSVVCDQVVPVNSLTFTIKDSSGVIQKSGVWASLTLQVVNKADSYPISTSADYTSGIFSVPLFDGTYNMTVSQSTGNGQNDKTFTVTVLNQQVTSVIDVATGSAMSKANGIYDLAFFSPNIKGTFKNADGTTLTITTNQYLNAELQIYENSNWNTVSSYWFNAASWQATISKAGKYRLKINPQSMPNLSTSYSDVFYVNAGRQTSLSETTGFIDQLTGFDIRILANNFNYKVINPIDQLPLSSGWMWIFKQESDGKENFYADGYVYPGSGGIGGKYLPEGNYRLILQPQNISSLDKNEYLITVNSSGAVTVKESGVNVTYTDGRYILKPTSANVTGRTVNVAGAAVGQTNNSGISIQVQKKNTNGSWDWLPINVNSDADGYFGLRIKDVGTYRLVLNPWRKVDVAATTSSEFTVTLASQSTFTKDFGSIVLNAPNVKISVVTSDTATALTNTYVGISASGIQSKENPWYLGLDTGDLGYVTTYIPDAGTYAITIQPPGNGIADGYVNKTYTATAVKDANGVVTVSIDPDQGATVVNGITRLKLGSSNLRGTVTATDGVTAVANSYVLPIQIIDGRSVERWDLGRSSDQNGKWSISLPAGVFSIKARAPYGSITLGSSATLGTIVVDANGNITSVPVGKSALAFVISLQAPTWSGVLKIPASEEVSTSAYVCLNYKVDENSYGSDCSQVNQLGQWALTLPDGITLDANSQLYVYDFQNKYPQIRLIGKSAIEAVIGASGTGKTLRFPSANINIAVTFAGAPVLNVGVNANRTNEWLGNAQTSALGIAGIYASNNADAFYAYVGIYNNATALDSQYVSTTKYFSSTEILSGTSGGIFNGTMALNAPNVKGVVRQPSNTSTPGAISNNSYLNVYDVEKGDWVSSASTALDGTFAIYLKPGCCTAKEYTLVLEPGVNKVTNVSDYVRKEYKVMVGTNGVAIITDKQTGNAVASETLSNTLVSRLTLGTANVSGSVVDPTGHIIAGVDVTSTGNCGIYSCYTWSDTSGGFKLNLPDQSATLQAGNWNSAGYVKSAECPITISGGVLTTAAGGCVQPDGTIKLALRTPNFTFTLKNSGTPVTNAWINFNIGKWWTYAPVDQNGKVSLFVDDAAVLAANGGQSGLTLTPHIYVDPYYSSGAVRWDCDAGTSKPICSVLNSYVTGQAWTTKQLGDIQVVTSNIKIKTIRPDNNAAVSYNGTVGIYRTDHGYDEWVGWSQTDGAGFTYFYLDEANYSGAKFKVRVIPSWDLRSTFAAKVWDNNGAGYNFADLNNLSLALATPNLKLTVVSPSSSNPNKWGWAYLEKVDTTTGTISWVDGSSLDDLGSTSFVLAASSRYKITANPGPGRSGTATQCFIQTDSSTAVSLVSGQCVGGSFSLATGLTLALARGNIIGTIFAEDGTTPLAGATIYANIVGATDESMAVVTCSLSDGSYGITLKEGYQWQLRVIPANYADDPIKYQTKIVATAIIPSPGVSTTINISLLRK